jgi:hypothetical protein
MTKLIPNRRKMMNSVTINGLTVTLDQIACFAPMIKFHPKEQYFPCSIEYLLAQAQLVQTNNGAFTPVVQNPTQADLATYYTDNYRVFINPQQFHGQLPDAHGTINAPMYVAVQVPADRTYVDLTFILLFAYQGPQTGRTIELGKIFTEGKVNFQLPHYGEHQGDIETVSVRVTPDLAQAMLVRLEAHGHSTYYGVDELDFADGHPIVCSVLNSHGTYNGRGKMPANDWFQVETHAPFVAFIDMIGQESYQWCPFAPQNLQIVGLDAQGNPINRDQLWAKFQGQIGAPQDNGFAGALSADAPLRLEQIGAIDAMAVGADFLDKIPDSKKKGDGTAGLGKRPYIVTTEPFMNQHGYLRSRLGENLVLAVNPANPTGPLIIDAWQLAQPTQLWQRIPYGHNSYALVNLCSGLLACSTGPDSITAQVPLSQLSDRSQWTWGGDKGNGMAAFRPLADSSQNLNVFGKNSEPYTPIYTWRWRDGQANELWRFDPLTEPASYYIRAKLSDTLVLSVDPNNPAGPLMTNTWMPNAPAQLWQWIRTTNGYALVNQLSGLAACFSRDEGQVIQTSFPAQLSGSSAWTMGDDQGGRLCGYSTGGQHPPEFEYSAQQSHTGCTNLHLGLGRRPAE